MNNRQTIKDLRLELERFAFASRNVSQHHSSPEKQRTLNRIERVANERESPTSNAGPARQDIFIRDSATIDGNEIITTIDCTWFWLTKD